METGSNKSLFTLIAVVIFGIFLSLSYWMFQDQMNNVLASVMDGVEEVTGLKIENSLSGNIGVPTEPSVPTVPEEVLVPNAESDFVFNATTGEITFYKGTKLDVVIPNKIGNIAVTGIGIAAFDAKGLTSIYIPESVTKISNKAFLNNKLTSVTIPNSVTSIGDLAFAFNKLTSVNLGLSLKTIGKQSFYGNLLTNVTLPNSLTSIGFHAFRVNAITSVEIPYSVITLEGYSFADNPLTSAKVQSGFTLRSDVFPSTTVVTRY